MRFLILVCLFMGTTSYASNETTERNKLKIQAYTLFAQERFDELDRLFIEFREGDTRTASGTLKFPLLHQGIELTSSEIGKDDDKGWSQQLQKAESWVEQHPSSPHAKVVYASVLISRGKAYRGGNYISQTDPSDLKMAYKYLSDGATYLLEDRELGETDPRWFRLLFAAYTILGAPDDEFDRLLEDALETHPNYDPFYFNATTSKSPQWGGSSKAIDDLAMLALKYTQAERGYELYARIYWAAPPQRDGRLHLMEDEINWDYFLLGTDAVLEKYPTQWNINHFAFFVCVRGDMEKASELLPLIEPPIIVGAWYQARNYSYCKSQVSRWKQSQAPQTGS